MTSTETPSTRTAMDFDPRLLPALSPLAKDLLAMDVDDDNAERMLLRVIESEPQLSIRLIAMANSTAYSHSGQSCKSIAGALQRIGLARSRQLAIAMLFGKPMRGKLPSELAESLWVHGLTMAAAAQEIARHKKTVDMAAAYLAGLVHDLGYMAEELCAPGALGRITQVSEGDHISLEQAETRALGVDHIDLSSRILHYWGAPQEIVEAIATHHELDIEPDSLAATLFGAEKLARFSEVTDVLYGEGVHPFPGMSIDRQGLDFLFRQQLELGAEEVTMLAARIIDQVDSFRQCARAMHGGY